MKILNYRIKNIRGISELEGNLDGRSVYVIGQNGIGKSSFIQAIFLACKIFGNKPYVKVGEDKGIVQLQLGESNSVEYTIERAFTASGSAVLTVRDSKGKALTKIGGLTPQKWLDQLLGTSMYYLSEFLEQDPKKQVKMFKEWFKIDTTELDEKYQKTYDKRTDEGREELRLKKVVEGHHYGYDDTKTYAEKKDITEISKELVAINQIENEKLAKEKEFEAQKELQQKAIEEHKIKMDNASKVEEEYENGIKACKEEIERLEARIREQKNKMENLVIAKDNHVSNAANYGRDLTGLRENLENMIEKSTKEIEAIEIPKKEAIEEKIKKAEEHNVKVDEVKKYSADVKALHEQEKVYRDLTEELKEIEKERAKKLEEANIPVPGLTFDENSLIYEDKPLIKDVVNDAKITEVLLTLLLRTNQQESKKTGEDRLSIFRLNGGELDDNTFKEIMKVVEEEGGSVFVEIPDSEAEDIEIKYIEE